MGSDTSHMGYRQIWDECGMWGRDEGKLDAKTGAQAPYLSPGFGDCGMEGLCYEKETNTKKIISCY